MGEPSRDEQLLARTRVLKARTDADLYLKFLHEDRERARRIILEYYGVIVDGKSADQRATEQMRAIVRNDAVNFIKNNPRLRAEFTRRMVRQLVGPPLPDPAAPPAAVRQPRDRKVSWQDVLGPAAAICIAVIVARSINRNASAANAAGQVTSVPPQYLIVVDRMEMEMTEESYRRWVASGKTGKIIPPVAATPTPGTPSAPSPGNVSGAPAAATTLFGKVRQSAPAVATPIADIDQVGLLRAFAQWQEIITGLSQEDPEHAVALLAQSTQNDAIAAALWTWLSVVTLEQLNEFITAMRDPQSAGSADRLLGTEGRCWLAHFLALIQGKAKSTGA